VTGLDFERYLRHLGATVDVVRNDVVDPAWFEAGYDGVLISPGPGDPKSAGAEARGLMNLKGHRSVGGMRASIYNAMPLEGVQALVDYLKEFERTRA